jgi:hypothetical protein
VGDPAEEIDSGKLKGAATMEMGAMAVGFSGSWLVSTSVGL